MMRSLLITMMLVLVLVGTVLCADTNSDCGLPADTGSCRGSFRRWAFDAEDGACKTFVYGGCKGNGNRFQTEEECISTCAPDQPY